MEIMAIGITRDRIFVHTCSSMTLHSECVQMIKKAGWGQGTQGTLGLSHDCYPGGGGMAECQTSLFLEAVRNPCLSGSSSDEKQPH